MKNLKKVLALVLAVVMIMGTVAVASAKDYADVKADSDYAEAIDVLSNLNILDGFKTGETYNFQPDGYFTRAQAAKIVAIVHNAATNGKIKGQDAISSTATHRTRSLTATTPGLCPSSTTAASLVWLTA
jgi:hypothetical protein